MTILLASRGWETTGLCLGLALLGAAFSGITARAVAKSMKPFVWILGLTFVLHVLFGFREDGTVWKVFGISVFSRAVWTGLVYSIRIGVMILLANLMTWTIPPLSITDAIEHLLKPLQRLKVPVQEMALMISLSIRFIPILFSESIRIQKAQMSRGILMQGPFWNRAKHAIPVVIPLFLSAFRRAHELALAMDARCYSIGCRRTPYGRLIWKGSDTFFSLGVLIVGCAMVWLDRRIG